jgi:hypothetical protein
MPKQGKLLPARRRRDGPQDGDSMLLRSAESIGRVIGTLQRQLDGARMRLSGISDDEPASPRGSNNGRPGPARKRTSKASTHKAAKRTRKASARNTTKRTRKTSTTTTKKATRPRKAR